MLVRYKDGRDKMIELGVSFYSLQFPYARPEQVAVASTPNTYGTSTYTTKNVVTMVEVPPYQLQIDRHGQNHTICIAEILDITIEAAHEYRQDQE